MPAKSSYPPGSIAPSQMPSLRMDKTDHAQTATHGGQGRRGQAYRAQQRGLMSSGQSRKAMADDIRDVRRIARDGGAPRKYNEGMLDMIKYRKCLEKHGMV